MRKKLKIDKFVIYSIIFWFGLGMIAFWIVMKLLGIFESPVWQEMLPYTGGIFAAGIFYQVVYDMKREFSVMKKRQDKMAGGLIRLESDFKHLREDMGNLKRDMGNLRQDFSHLRQDFDRHLAKH